MRNLLLASIFMACFGAVNAQSKDTAQPFKPVEEKEINEAGNLRKSLQKESLLLPLQNRGDSIAGRETNKKKYQGNKCRKFKTSKN